MKTTRFILPAVGLLAALGATYSIARTAPHRERTEPPAAPPAAAFSERVAAVGLVETSTENIAIGTPLSGVVTRVFVSAGQTVRRGDPLFSLDTRHLQADYDVRQGVVTVARARAAVASARLEDVRRLLSFAEQVKDPRAISAEEMSRRRSAVDTVVAELAHAQSEVAAAESLVRSIHTDIERSTVRAPLDAEVLQVRLRAGEFAPAAVTTRPFMLLGRRKPLHVRVDVDEHEGWRVRSGAPAMGHVRGNPQLDTPLTFVRFEPFVLPKTSLTGDSTERVDTRVLQVIYRIDRGDLPLFVGQQLDVFIDGAPAAGAQVPPGDGVEQERRQ
jgi:multidrug efflux pump subunit AcrA (membrane-fusion protein)